MSDASVIFSIFFQFSMSAGIALSALFLRLSMVWNNHHTPAHVDINLAFIGISVLVLFSMIDVYRLEKSAGQQVLG